MRWILDAETISPNHCAPNCVRMVREKSYYDTVYFSLANLIVF
jgi:hypothetical protein